MENQRLHSFKSILEYFVAHLSYVNNNNSIDGPGYSQYIQPLVNSHSFNHTGQGWREQQIQEQVKEWDTYGDFRLLINITPSFGNYKTRRCYLNWEGTGFNIVAAWNGDKITELHIIDYLYWEKPPQWIEKNKSYKIEELGLFDDNKETTNELVDFYNYYYNMMKTNTECRKNDYFINSLNSNHNLILTGAPGTGKTYLAKQLACMMITGKTNVDDLTEEEMKMYNEQHGFVQFHPSYDYTDFVEGLRPKQDEAGNVGFERRDGVFKSFCKKAINSRRESSKYVFIIDEINRGDMSKIFGELFFSIETGYRGTKGLVKTQYQNLIDDDDVFKDGFYVPDNIYIIGTMNDIDRSVESMDFAMRRRFAFKEICAEDRMDMIKENSKLAQHYPDIEQRMRNLNLAILTIQSLSKAYQIGAAYFLKLENYLTDDGNIDDSSWNMLWDNHLYGLLFEYLRGLPNADDDMRTLHQAYNMKDNYDMKDDKHIKDTENV